MSSILDTSSIYNSYYAQNVSSAAGADLQSRLEGVESVNDDEELMDVCKDFESFFVQKLIEEAKKTLENEDEQGEYMQYFGSMLNEAYADAVVDGGGIGLAQQLYDSMKTQYNL